MPAAVDVQGRRFGRLIVDQRSTRHGRHGRGWIWSTHQPSGQRIPDKVRWAVEILTLYAPELLAAEAASPDRGETWP